MSIEGKKILRKYDVPEMPIHANYPTEVAIAEIHQDFGGVMVYGKYHGEWKPNTGERAAVRCLLEDVETLRAVNAELLAACGRARIEFEHLSRVLKEPFVFQIAEALSQIRDAISKAIST